MRENLTKEGKLGLRLLEDLTALAAGGSVCANKMPQFYLFVILASKLVTFILIRVILYLGCLVEVYFNPEDFFS